MGGPRGVFGVREVGHHGADLGVVQNIHGCAVGEGRVDLAFIDGCAYRRTIIPLFPVFIRKVNETIGRINVRVGF